MHSLFLMSILWIKQYRTETYKNLDAYKIYISFLILFYVYIYFLIRGLLLSLKLWARIGNFHFSFLPQECLLSNFPEDQNYRTLHETASSLNQIGATWRIWI